MDGTLKHNPHPLREEQCIKKVKLKWVWVYFAQTSICSSLYCILEYYPASHSRASEALAIAGWSQKKPGGQGWHFSTLLNPGELENVPGGHGKG